jgi:hypothetical protein
MRNPRAPRDREECLISGGPVQRTPVNEAMV